MATPRVFVSHSHKDDAFTHRLVNDLKQAGADAWVDVADIGAGDFLERINSALASCEWVVLVLTRDALNSPWVKQEINAANRLKHKGRIRDIIPILAGPVDDDDIPPLWGVFNIFDATSTYVQAKEAVLRTLGLASGTGVPQTFEELSKSMAPAPAADALSEAFTFWGAPVSEPVTSTSVDGLPSRRVCGPVPQPVTNPYDYNEKVVKRQVQENAKALENRGHHCYLEGEYGRALHNFKRAIRLTPSSASAWAGKAKALWKLGRALEAMQAEERAIELGWKGDGSISPPVSDTSGDGFLPAFDERSVYRPVSPPAASRVPPPTTLPKEFVGEEEYWDWLRAQPNEEYGHLSYLDGNYIQALHYFKRAIRVNPSSASAWAGKAQALWALGSVTKSRQAEEWAKELGWKGGTVHATVPPQDIEALENNGRIAFLKGDYAKALEEYSWAVWAKPNPASAWAGKAQALRALGRLPEAEEAEQQARALGWMGAPVPEPVANTEGRFNGEDSILGPIIYEHTAEQQREYREYTYFLLGEGDRAFGEGRYADALGFYDRAISRDPEYAGNRRRLANNWERKAKALRALGRLPEAEEAEQQARELHWKADGLI